MTQENGGAPTPRDAAEPTAIHGNQHAQPDQQVNAHATAPPRPTAAPLLSPAGRQLLDAAAERDAEIACTTEFYGLWEFRAHLAGLDAEQREQLMLDGARWRRWCSLTETARRYELAHRDEARLSAESEAAVRKAIRASGGIGPSFRELQHRRAQPGRAHTDAEARRGRPYEGGPVRWGDGRPCARGGDGR